MAHYTQLGKKDINHLASAFGLPPPLQVRPVLEGTVNTYYFLSYPDKAYYLKIDEVGDLARLKKELRILVYLKDRQKKLGYLTPTPLPTRSGKLYAPFRRKFLLLFEKIEGKSFHVGRLDPSKLKKIGSALAYLHKVCRDIAISPHRFHFLELKQVYSQIEGKLTAKHPAVNLQIRSWLTWLQSHRPRRVPEGLIHADLFPENILFDGNKLSGILDFEAAGRGPLLFDIAVALHACCAGPSGLCVNSGRHLMKGYQSVRKLSRVEKKYFEYFLFESALRFLLTRLRDFELKKGVIHAKPFKDYREYVGRFSEISGYSQKII